MTLKSQSFPSFQKYQRDYGEPPATLLYHCPPERICPFCYCHKSEHRGYPSLICDLLDHIPGWPVSSLKWPSLLCFPFCCHVLALLSMFWPQNPSLCISTPYSRPAHGNAVSWIRNSPLLREIYKTCLLSKAETDFLEMNVIQMSIEALHSLWKGKTF